MKRAIDTAKETVTQMIDMMKNVAVNSNVGQNLDTRG